MAHASCSRTGLTGQTTLPARSLRTRSFWKQVGGTFDTGPETKLVVLRIQRMPAGDAIRGKLWIGGVRLARRSPD